MIADKKCTCISEHVRTHEGTDIISTQWTNKYRTNECGQWIADMDLNRFTRRRHIMDISRPSVEVHQSGVLTSNLYYQISKNYIILRFNEGF